MWLADSHLRSAICEEEEIATAAFIDDGGRRFF
jgi:hypothetical protein